MTAWQRISRVLCHPLTIILAIAAGIFCGGRWPGMAAHVRIIATLYGDLLRMIVLPFILSAIMFSLRSLLRDAHAARFIGRIGALLVAATLAAAIVTAAVTVALEPGRIDDPATLAAFGRVVAHDGAARTDLETTLHGAPAVAAPVEPDNLLLDLVPTNIFAALAQGDVLKVLVFALLFGVAISLVPDAVSAPLGAAMETIFRSCQSLTRAFNLLLPFASFAMVADQAATIGLDRLMLMLRFLLVLGALTLAVALVAILASAVRLRRSPWSVLVASRSVIFAAIATRSSTACMTNMIDCLADQLGLKRGLVELLVPIYTALLRIGPTVLYVAVPIFVAQLYGHALAWSDLVLLCLLGSLFGLASAGMTGLVVLTQAGLVCARLGLPFDAALILFIAIEPISDTLRTLMLVLSINAAAVFTMPREAVPADAMLVGAE